MVEEVREALGTGSTGIGELEGRRPPGWWEMPGRVISIDGGDVQKCLRLVILGQRGREDREKGERGKRQEDY